jgi:hypothetical protein
VYSSGATANLLFETNNSERMRLDSSGNLGIGTSSPDANLTVNGAASFAAGTALLPSIARAGDLNTGIFFPAADTIAFSEGGAEAMRITSAGNVGIGTSSPTGILSLYGANPVLLVQDTETSLAASDSRVRLAESTTGGALGSYYDLRLNAGAFTVDYDGTERMRLDSSGNLGIGTSSPGGLLQVGTRFRVRSDGVIFWGSDVNTPSNTGYLTWDVGVAAIGFNGTGALRFDTSNLERMRLDSAGNLGIGTSSPRVRFQVTPVSNPSEPSLGTANDGSVFTSANGLYGLNLGVSAAGYTWMQAMRFDGVATAYNLVLQAAGGNVGIGTSSPAQRLTVVDSGNIVAQFQRSSPSSEGAIRVGNETGSAYVGSAGEDMTLVAPSNTGRFFFSTGVNERMRIDPSGNLLVGLTSATGVAKLQVSGPIRTTGYTVATLPAGTVGMRTYVTDALAPSFGVAVAGSGAVTIPVFYDGANWIVA